jgi:hypothetical protein
MTNPAAIAQIMTKAQRRVLLLAKGKWADPEDCGLGPNSRQAIYNAERFKVIEIGPNRFRLTPLGAKVRAVLGCPVSDPDYAVDGEGEDDCNENA